MAEIKLPDVLQQALDAEAAWKACDRKLHPRLEYRRWEALRATNAAFRAEYPHLDEWLFSYPRYAAERQSELRRLIAACKGD